MKNKILYPAILALALSSCADDALMQTETSFGFDKEVVIPEGAKAGELLVKFKPEMTEILDKTLSTVSRSGGKASRSGIPSMDEVLEILGGYQFERVFPVDKSTEERTRKAGLHLWYVVKFDENSSLQEAARKLSKLGEVSAVQANHEIKRAYRTDVKRTYVSHSASRSASVAQASNGFFNDPGLKHQWHFNNTGDYAFNGKNAEGKKFSAVASAGSDVNCEAAWQLCTGDPSIIVAVLDEAVMYNHDDLEANMWVNEGEELYSGTDADGNGYAGDKYGYNFVKNTGLISWQDENNTGHGTHVAGTIAAVNGNGIGVSGIAGGNGTNGTGVKIMSCQVFDGMYGVTLDGEAKAIKYAADNGAVILQCSWGYNSANANMVEGYQPGPATEEEWTELYPLEKDALDYFIHNAGSPNGVIDGGIAIFAAGNEYSLTPAFPGAYSKCVCVGAVDASYYPSSYTNYGAEVDLSAPGGDADYYGFVGTEDPYNFMTIDADHETQGSIFSTTIMNGQPSYGYMDGTSMACPHVSGVAALGLSYAVKERRHFKAEEFVGLMKESVKDLYSHYTGKKTYFKGHVQTSAPATSVELSAYRNMMGTGLIDARKLLEAVAGSGADMKLPNIYVGVEAEYSLDLAAFFVDGENLQYTCSVADASVATATITNSVMVVKGLKNGTTTLTVKAGNAEQTVVITVRKSAGDNGWM